ncbi:hypothetical protein Dsin_019866 [Dipteronia sinensis]|uniref:Pentatricopeptide repeat-containing protein n=1 Tax=Dipteronia sinensis TaxID=43782 RepID=A0AAE0A8D3_9ROSI|nr:hypothetical protein Dsin_019866 [Dipteronia sinensis]
MREAQKLFEELSVRDVVLWKAMVIQCSWGSWNTIMAVGERCGDLDGTLRVFDIMLGASIQPDLVTITTLLSTCCHLVERFMDIRLLMGWQRMVNVRILIMYVLIMNNAVMDMNAKCRSMRDAQMVFNEMSNKDVGS